MDTPPPISVFDPLHKALRLLAARCDGAGVLLFERANNTVSPVNELARNWTISIDHEGSVWSRDFGLQGRLFVLVSPRSPMVAPESLLLRAGTPSKPPVPFEHRAAFDAVATLIVSTASDLIEHAVSEETIDGLTTQVTDSFETVHFLYTLGRSMSDTAAPDRFIQLICDTLRVSRQFGWVTASFLRNADPNVTLAGSTVTSLVPGQHATALDIGSMIQSPVAVSDRPRIIEVPANATAERDEIVVQPLGFGGKVVGTLMAGGRQCQNGQMSSYDTQLLEGAARYANSFLNACALYRGQERMFLGIVRSLTASIDAKDSYTRGHSERVAHVARELAIVAGFEDAVAQRVHFAGLLHDVGKIGVPEAVLCKQGRLTDAEFDLIKQHPSIGHNILCGIPLLEDILPGVLHHHERFDGKGYPGGLVGHAIPLFARLLAIADTFDAMSSNRSYRAALPRERVLDEIANSAGTQFDPAFAQAFPGIDLSEYDRLVALHHEQSRAA